MKNRERYDNLNEVIEKLDSTVEETVALAELLEIEDYKVLGDRAREIAGEVENLRHDIFQRNITDNA